MTELIDGSVKMIRRYYYRMISFLRKRNIQVPQLSEMEKMEDLVQKYESKPHLDQIIRDDIQEMIEQEHISQKRILEGEEHE